MNKEKFKTLLLAFLVLITIFLGKNLRDTTLHNSTAGYREEKSEEEKDYNLSDVIIPRKTVVSFNENEKTVIYSNNRYDMWNTGKVVLKDIFKSKNIEKNIVDVEKYNSLTNDRFINFQFSENLYTSIVGKILGIEIPKEIYSNLETIKSIKFSIGENSFLVLSNGSDKLILAIDAKSLNKLSEIIDEIEESNYTKFYKLEDVLGIKSDVYIPVKSKSKIATVHVNTKYEIAKDINLDDTIAELFFYKKIEYIKKIEESSGASIYIDGENVLKIYEDRRVEYIGSIEENNEKDLYSSIKTAVDFVSNHRGWPENVYLSNIEKIEGEGNIKGYEFIFRYKLNGLTVFSDKNDIQDKIEVEVLNGSITSYKSRIWNYLGMFTRDSEVNTLSAFEIIDNNFMILKDEYIKNSPEETKNMKSEEINDKVKDSIEDIYLAYYGDLNGKQEVLNPVWVIELLGNNYIFDAYSGERRS